MLKFEVELFIESKRRQEMRGVYVRDVRDRRRSEEKLEGVMKQSNVFSARDQCIIFHYFRAI